MPVSVPPPEALAEFLNSSTRHTRRIEIYEQDGVTRWERDTEVRLKGGTVTIGYDRDERRALDLTLSNEDGVLVTAPGEFWYDKVIKVFRGVLINAPTRQPRIVIVSDNTGFSAQSQALRTGLQSVGLDDITINSTASDYLSELRPFDIIVALGDADKGALLKQAYDDGKPVFVIRKGAEYFFNQILGTTTWTGTTGAQPPDGSTISPRNVNDPRTLGWKTFAISTEVGTWKAPASSLSNIFGVAFAPSSATTYAITSGTNGAGGKFVAIHYPVSPYQYSDAEFLRFLYTQFLWLNPVTPLEMWECQVGEFMIDRISQPRFPYEVKITGRDYTKKALLAKFTQATQYDAGLSLESVIGALAVKANINKRLLPITDIVIGRAFFFERGKTIWEAMKEICTAYNYEIFFDATGYLVIRPFRDPTTTTPTIWVRTGSDGVIASYTKSTSDASLFNHVLVSGESSDSDAILVWSERKNTDPNSPTNVDEIGDRYWEFVSEFIETQAQADELADSYLAIHQLEEFQLDFETLMFPWLEVGEILGWVDPDPAPDDPDTFLLSDISIPLELAPMAMTGRRVMIVSGS